MTKNSFNFAGSYPKSRSRLSGLLFMVAWASRNACCVLNYRKHVAKILVSSGLCLRLLNI